MVLRCVLVFCRFISTSIVHQFSDKFLPYALISQQSNQDRYSTLRRQVGLLFLGAKQVSLPLAVNAERYSGTKQFGTSICYGADRVPGRRCI